MKLENRMLSNTPGRRMLKSGVSQPTQRLTLLRWSLDLSLLFTILTAWGSVGWPAMSGIGNIVLGVIQIGFMVLSVAALFVLRQWLSALQTQDRTSLVGADRAVQQIWRWLPWVFALAVLSGAAVPGVEQSVSNGAVLLVLIPASIGFAVWWYFSEALRDWIRSATQAALNPPEGIAYAVRNRLLIWLTWGRVLSVVSLLMSGVVVIFRFGLEPFLVPQFPALIAQVITVLLFFWAHPVVDRWNTASRVRSGGLDHVTPLG
ncbi:hypothetical protein [Deinococcus arboris]|nr:hypothetical protein [Deinococcus arboris]